MYRVRHTHLLQRPLVEKFWTPFNEARTGSDVGQYGVKQVLQDIVDPGIFSCQFNGAVGGSKVAEDFFVVLLTGFDITGVSLHPGMQTDKKVSGGINVVHTRPFISWKPTQASFMVPFKMDVEVIDTVISHMCFQCEFTDALITAGCPEEIANMTMNGEAMKMLVTLRRARVKPSAITYNALNSASKKAPMWSSALGIL